jgi:thioesterase domain-containing protein
MAATLSPSEIGAYLRKHIPISASMGVEVLVCSPGQVRLRAPLAANLNHRATVFGGSASAVAILAAWTWLHFALRGAGYSCRVVIQRNEMEYLAPIDGDFTAECDALNATDFEKLLRTLQRHGKARAGLNARLLLHGRTVARFSGDYVAMAIRS